MGKGYRQGRLGEEIRKIVSELLLRELKDPGLSSMISVTAVEVTSDGSYATVYLSVLRTVRKVLSAMRSDVRSSCVIRRN